MAEMKKGWNCEELGRSLSKLAGVFYSCHMKKHRAWLAKGYDRSTPKRVYKWFGKIAVGGQLRVAIPYEI
ncbi:hypothetical protein WG66_000338 [Moniliophthora roreri]|nr:hypothetical protein WG66_000338 [Moniliophthora roreri]